MSRQTKRTKRNVGPWSTDRVLLPNSPITTKDVHGFLINCVLGWDSSYTEAEKRDIIETLPTKYQHVSLGADGKIQCPITIEQVTKDTHIKRAATKFKSDVKDGLHDQKWLNLGHKALQDRREGKFDTYLGEYVEDMFGNNEEGAKESGSDGKG